MPARSLARSTALTMLSLGASCGGGAQIARAPDPHPTSTTVDASTPAASGIASGISAADLAPARRVASGDSFDCAIAADGQLWCWTSAEDARAIARFEHTQSLSQHSNPSCAARDDGSIACVALVDAIGGPAVVFVDHARFAWTDVADVSRVASPCVVLSEDRAVECVLPSASMPSFFADAIGLARTEARPRTRLAVGPARDLAATPRQICVVDDGGALWCLRPARAPHVVTGLPPLRSVAMGLGCGELVCGVSRDDELVCLATDGATGSVRVPGVRDVAIDGCTVCMASLDGRLACFGEPGDRVPFTSSPHLVPGVSEVVQIALGPRGGVALTQDERLLAFDAGGRRAPITLPVTSGRAEPR